MMQRISHISIATSRIAAPSKYVVAPFRAFTSPPFTLSSDSTPSSPTKRPSMKESSTEAAQRAFALRLYKAIMRAHRTVLPDAMRALGDTYVREEFKLHKSAKPQHLHGFFTGWIQYLEMMRSQGPGAWGKQLESNQMENFTAEQKQQLELLQKAAANLDAQWSNMQQDENPVTIPASKDNLQ